jgi:lipopolysaccharide cholinephosphotransferase
MNNEKKTYQKLFKIEVNENNYKEISFPDDFLKEIYNVVRFTKELCERENIEYFIDGGTMLGCVRDGGQILYDNDADFGMTPDNFKKLLKFENEFKQKYIFEIEPNKKVRIISMNAYILQKEKNIDGTDVVIAAGLDILIYKTFKENNISKIMIQDELIRKQYPHSWHYQKHLYPLKDYIYRCLDAEPLTLKGANNPKNYLDGTYPDWQTKKIYDHKVYVFI